MASGNLNSWGLSLHLTDMDNYTFAEVVLKIESVKYLNNNSENVKSFPSD